MNFILHIAIEISYQMALLHDKAFKHYIKRFEYYREKRHQYLQKVFSKENSRQTPIESASEGILDDAI